MMASSQVEIGTSSPFGCTTVMHNRRNRCFQNNPNIMVTPCVPNGNSSHIDYDDLWVHHPQWQTSPTNTECKNDHKGNNNNGNTNNNGGLIDSGGKIESHIHHLHRDKWARARQMVLSVDSSSPKEDGSNSPTISECSVQISNLHGGVSSLVRKWRGFEAEAKCSRSNTGTAFSDNIGLVPPGTDDDTMFGDWESDRTTCSGPPSARSRDSDATERERLRVADIIRKLSEDRLNDLGCDSSPRYGTSSSDHLHQADLQRCLASSTVSSPRIRGRQAFNDLLVQMERERHNELEGLVARKAVSKFSHRGRIQAALRVRFLRRGLESKECRYLNDPSYESHKLMRSTIIHSRERVDPSYSNSSFKSGSQPREKTEDQQYQVLPHHQRVGVGHIRDEESSTTSKEKDVNPKFSKVNQNQQQSTTLLPHSDNVCEVTSPSWQVTNEECNNDGAEKSSTIIQSLQSIQIHTLAKDEEATTRDLESKGEKRHLTKTTAICISNDSVPEMGLEELDSNRQQQIGNTTGWICEISRPRSDWEGLRQARYQEMLDPFLENDEIRTLLGRRSVSNFLSSCLREQIDKVMRSRAQGQQTLMNNQTQEPEKTPVEEDKNENDESQVSDKGDFEDEQYEEKEDYADYYDEYGEAQSQVEILYNEFDDNMNQMGSSSPPSWAQNQINDVSDFSDQVASPSTQQSLSSNSYSQDNRPSSSFATQPAIELELIYDLKGHMQQLYQEMSELRKSIRSCMKMQNKLQHSIKKEVAAALSQSDIKNEEHKQVKNIAARNRCCICRKMQVNSLLYRCGHMCTCFDCSQELQLGNGTCPICRAPIVDVVKTYSNS